MGQTKYRACLTTSQATVLYRVTKGYARGKIPKIAWTWGHYALGYIKPIEAENFFEFIRVNQLNLDDTTYNSFDHPCEKVLRTTNAPCKELPTRWDGLNFVCQWHDIVAVMSPEAPCRVPEKL